MSTSRTEWNRCRLGDFVTFQRGFDITQDEQSEGPYPVFSSSGPNSKHATYKLEGPGVIIGRKGTLGTVFYSSGRYWPHDTTLWVKDFHGNDPKFSYYFLKTLRFDRLDAGAANPTLNRNHIHPLQIEIPGVPGQRRIAAILSAYDDLIENNRRRIKLLEEAARLLYREWFVHLRFPGHEHTPVHDGVPQGWMFSKIEDVAGTVGGGTPSTKNPEYWENGEIVWFVPTDLSNNDCLVLLDSERKITPAGLNSSSAKLLPPDTILMTSRASIGYFGLYDGTCATNQGFIAIIPKQEVYRYYLLFNLIHRKEEIEGRAGGTTFREINRTTFRSMNIVLPGENLAKQFELQVKPIHNQVRLLKRQALLLTKARDLLLPRLMSGEIEV